MIYLVNPSWQRGSLGRGKEKKKIPQNGAKSIQYQVFWIADICLISSHNRELGHFVVKVSFSIGSDTTTARSTKTSLKK